MTKSIHILHISLNRHYVGGGLVNHVDKLMLKQASKGYKVSYFSSGKDFFLGLPSIKKVSIKKLAGITIYELRNSPNKPLKQRGRPLNEIFDPLIESCFKKVLDDAKPDIVHIHDLQGLCASLIDVSIDSGYKTIFTFHNYWPLCPEVELFDYEDKNCTDYKEGARCVTCNYSPPSYYLKLMLSSKLKPVTGSSLYRKVKDLFKLGNVHTNDKSAVDTTIAGFYAKRRKSFIKCINRCNMLLAISSRVKEIYAGYGAEQSKIKVINNALFADDQTMSSINALRESRTFERKGRIRFSFRGRMTKGKGINICLDAFRHIDPERAVLYLYGDADKPLLEWINSQKLKNVFYKGRYDVKDLPDVLNGIDVGIVPPLLEECFGTVGLEFMAAGIPVLASRIGGLTDYIEDGVNGLLFEPANSAELASLINRIINNPNLIKELAARIPQKLKTLDDLFLEMDGVYKTLL